MLGAEQILLITATLTSEVSAVKAKTNSVGCSAQLPAPSEDFAEQMELFPRHSFSTAALDSARFALSLDIPVPPQLERSPRWYFLYFFLLLSALF